MREEGEREGAGGGICQIGIIQMKKKKKKELMIIPPIGSQLPNNFSRPTYVHSFAESFPSGGAFLLVLQIFAPKSKCGGGRGRGCRQAAVSRPFRALFAPCSHVYQFQSLDGIYQQDSS